MSGFQSSYSTVLYRGTTYKVNRGAIADLHDFTTEKAFEEGITVYEATEGEPMA